jgi:hypothetical protein
VDNSQYSDAIPDWSIDMVIVETQFIASYEIEYRVETLPRNDW